MLEKKEICKTAIHGRICCQTSATVISQEQTVKDYVENENTYMVLPIMI